MSRIQSQQKLREIRLKNYLQIQKKETKKAHGGSGSKQSWRVETNTLGCSFRNLIKSLTYSDGSVKGAWANW